VLKAYKTFSMGILDPLSFAGCRINFVTSRVFSHGRRNAQRMRRGRRRMTTLWHFQFKKSRGRTLPNTGQPYIIALLGKYPEGGSRLREQTKETVAAVIRHLKAGKSPKEVACLMNVTWSCVKLIIYRHRQVRLTYIETYGLRHPQRSGPPEKIINPLRQANQL
jgi:hypothetical protein